MSREFDAAQMLSAATRHYQIHLSLLIADTALWAHPEVHRRLIAENGTGCWFSNVRRHRPGQGEQRGTITAEGIKLDDNTYANNAIKRAIGVQRDEVYGFEACHIWPGTCYDPRHHTAIANLILVPRAIAGVTDHDPEVQAAVQYRAFELYGWYPEGAARPSKPEFYPEVWRDPEPFGPEVRQSMERRRFGSGSQPRQEVPEPRTTVRPARAVAAPSHASGDLREKIRRWAQNPGLNVHRIVGVVANSTGGIDREDLVRQVAKVTGSRNPYGAVSSLLTSKGNAYGEVFIEMAGRIFIHPDAASEVSKYRWM